MCGRYYIPDPDDDAGFRAILEQVQDNCKQTPFLTDMQLGEIYPTNIVPVITETSPVLMKWGFSRYDGKGQIINARLETADEKPMFKKAFDSKRCLIPAGHYFEWQKAGVHKHKYAIGTGAPIYMAGLYKFEKDMPLPLFVILTRPATPDIAFIHDRMPVIVPEHIRSVWLAEGFHCTELLERSDVRMSYSDA